MMDAADTAILISWDRGQDTATVVFTGRDVWGEDFTIRFDGGRWSLVSDNAREYQAKQEYESDPLVQTIRALAKEHPEGGRWSYAELCEAVVEKIGVEPFASGKECGKRLAVLHQRYREFSKAAGLRTQYERTEVAGFWEKPTRTLVSSSNSGIMGSNDSREIPDVSTTSTPRRTLTPEDVTKEYMEAATPGRGTVTYEDGYVVKTHRNEIKMADWLYRTFGGDIRLLKESKEPGGKTPDFRWNGRGWELKGVSSKNSVDRAVREAAKQIEACPGGIILDASSSELAVDVIENVIGDRIRRIALDSVDVMIVSDEDLKKIMRYKK